MAMSNKNIIWTQEIKHGSIFVNIATIYLFFWAIMLFLLNQQIYRVIEILLSYDTKRMSP